MKKGLLFITIFILSYNSFSQISFEKGYFIKNSGKKIECLIKNIDWKNNPTEFEYKLTDIEEPKKATIESIKEFGVYNFSKFKKVNVEIDRSSENINNMNSERNPSFQNEVLFLKSLIEGKANLYSYQDSNLTRYFFSKDSSKIKQLIFKHYLNSDGDVSINDAYRQQLFNELKCDAISISNIKKTDYKKNDLIKLFEKYNACYSSEKINYKENTKKSSIDFNIKIGLNNSSLSMNNINSSSNGFDFSNKIVPKFGFETEFYFPYNKNKWSSILELSYHKFNADGERTVFPNSLFEDKEYAQVNYNSIELLFGFRHYLYLNASSKVFINVSYIFDLNQNSKITIEDTNIDVGSNNNFSLGFGYKYDEKYSIEFSYHTKRNISGDKEFWIANYNTISIGLGYTIF